MSRVQNALVLQGGGALGAYELGVIQRLLEVEDLSFDVVAGVSIGAVNAAVLVGGHGDPRQALEAIWEDFSVSAPRYLPTGLEPLAAVFGNPSLFRPRVDYYAWPVWTSFYDSAPLRRALGRHVDFERIAASECVLTLTAVNIETGAIEVFDNRDPARPLDAEHVLASGSLPPGLPMVELDEAHYWDGGLFDNTPLAPVIDRLDPDPQVRKRVFVIELFPSAGPVPRSMLEVFDRLFEMIFAGKFAHDLRTVRRINEYIDVIRHLDEALDEIPSARAETIRALPGYRRLRAYMAIDEVISVRNANRELALAPFDFSRACIDRRRQIGYGDAERVLREHGIIG
jgi:predicted acylesterase/phospholipase RssA